MHQAAKTDPALIFYMRMLRKVSPSVNKDALQSASSAAKPTGNFDENSA